MLVQHICSAKSDDVPHVTKTCDPPYRLTVTLNVKHTTCTMDKASVICPNLTTALNWRSLDQVCIYLESNTTYHLGDAEMIQFNKSVTNFSIQSEDKARPAIIQCADNIRSCGLVFEKSSDILFRNLHFKNCTGTVTRSDKDTLALLTFSASKNIIFVDVRFNRTIGSSVFLIDSKNVSLLSCSIFNGTGNAIKILFKDKTEDNGNFITISDSYFFHNKANPKHSHDAQASTSDGKGSAISILLLNKVSDNQIVVNSSIFENNNATYGGAVFIYAANQTKSNKLSFDNVSFCKNHASRSGGSVYVGYFSRFEKKNPIFIQNTLFDGNTADPVYGGAAIFAYNSYLMLRGNNSFIKNKGTALVLGATTMNVTGDTVLEDNSGIYGGAMYLYKCSTIVLSPKSYTIFHRNNASKDGGALFVFHLFQKKHSHCFFSPENKTLSTGNVTFVNNSAGVYGNHIYMSTLKLCPNLSFQNLANEHIYLNPQKNNSVSTAIVNFSINKKQWSEHIPGFYFSPNIIIHDELGQTVQSSVQIHTANNSFRTYAINKQHKVNITLLGKPVTDYEVNFIVDSELGQLYEKICVNLDKCPTQYVLKDGKCVCNSRTSFASKCTLDNKLHLLPNHWSSPGGNTYLCPNGYCAKCRTSKGSGIQRYCSYIWKRPCRTNRNQTSRLCSKCAEGLSVSFGNTECVDATGTRGYIFIPLVVIVLILFSLVVMAACNYDIYAAYFIPVILFYQLAPNMLTVESVNMLPRIVFTMFHSDERLMSDLHFSKDFDDLHKIWTRFCTALAWAVCYTLLMICAFYCKIAVKLAVLRCWPFVFLLFYVDIIKFAIYALRGLTIDKTAYLYKFADEKYMGERHFPLFLVAVFSVVITLVFIIVIMTKALRKELPSLMEYDDRDNTLDSIVSYRKIKWLFAFYALYILFFLLLDNVTWVLLLVIIFTGIFTFKQPYKSASSKYFNHFEVFVYFDILLIGIINQNPCSENVNVVCTPKYISAVLMVLPFLGCLFWIFYTFFGFLKTKSGVLSKYHLFICIVL